MIEKSKYFAYLQPEPEDPVVERINDFIWIDKHNIICSVPKENSVKLSLKEFYDQISWWEENFGTERRYMVTVVNPHVKSTKEERDLIAEIFPKYVLGLAVLNDSALGRMAINLFIGLRPPTYPLKVFKKATDAKNWLLSLKENGEG